MTDALRRYTIRKGMVYDTYEQEYLTQEEICRVLNNLEEGRRQELQIKKTLED